MNYPTPIPASKPTKLLSASSQNRRVFIDMERGQTYCAKGTYGTAMSFYSWLKKQVSQMYPITDYESSRVNRDKLRELSQRLLVRIKGHQIDLQKAPPVPWLLEFYPNSQDFYLPFTDVLGINGAYQWYVNGIQFPGLQHKVHPYYGAYFPTRTEHLQLFDQWLQQNKPKGKALDLGTGCGVLTFYMLKHDVKDLMATDINPNAIYSVGQELNRLDLGDRVRLICTDLLEGISCENIDLLVFNPPWIPDNATGSLDLAMYYHNDLFERFFSSAYEVLPPKCKVVVLFSTFAQAAGLKVEHPIRHELEHHQRFKLVNYIQSPVNQKPSHKKSWLSEIRSNEKIELWELERMNR
jgi:hypothetical protein